MRPLRFDLPHLSTYRNLMMGAAAIMIIVCHAEASNVMMPNWLARALSFGNFGVDIFLFLSGLGCFYSLSRMKQGGWGGVVSFYKRRLYRIYPSYLIVFVPFCIIYLILGIYSVGECILSVSALEFWFYHRGAWFISLITPLYLISPLLFRFFQGKGKWLWATIIAVVLTLLCSISIDNQSNTSVWNNIQDAFGRAPSFIIGMAIAKECRDKLRISLLCPICLFVLYFPLHGLFPSAPLTWLFVPSILILLVWTLQLLVNIKWVERCLSFMGSISLESYLVNISFNALLNTVISYYCLSSSSLLYGKYLQYSIVIVVGTLLAFLVNKYSKKFLAKS